MTCCLCNVIKISDKSCDKCDCKNCRKNFLEHLKNLLKNFNFYFQGDFIKNSQLVVTAQVTNLFFGEYTF